MAWREGRASRRRLALLTASIAVGVSALVAINSFTDNLQASVRAQARALLGADLAVSTNFPFSPRASALLDELRAAAATGRRSVTWARVTSLAAMAYVPRTAGSRLVQLQAAEPGYPFFGAIETSEGLWPCLQEDGAFVDPRCGPSSRGRRHLSSGEARIRCGRDQRAGRRGCPHGLRARVFCTPSTRRSCWAVARGHATSCS
jgi:predicted lysophospholipase L1 biosynthesis ABC-type transport system permease subunit